jgi:hypothetical protein
LNDLADRALRLAIAWAVLVPLWLLTVAALAWGRASLSRAEVRMALSRTLAASVLLVLPAAWAVMAYLAGFNPRPTASRMVTGGFLAALFLPVYSAIVACGAFQLAVQSARRRGAVPRPLAIRVLTGLAIAAVLVFGFVAFVTSFFMAAGPKAFG